MGTLEAVSRCGSCISPSPILLPGPSRCLGRPPGLTKLENRPLEKQREAAWEGPGCCAERAPQGRVTWGCCSPSQLSPGGGLQWAGHWADSGQEVALPLRVSTPARSTGGLGTGLACHRPTQLSPLPAQGSVKPLNPWARTPTGAGRPPAPTGRCRVPSAAWICDAHGRGETFSTARNREAPQPLCALPSLCSEWQ